MKLWFFALVWASFISCAYGQASSQGANPDGAPSQLTGLCMYWGEIGLQIHQDMRQVGATQSRANARRKLEERYNLAEYDPDGAAYKNYQALLDKAEQGASQNQLFEMGVELCQTTDDQAQLDVDQSLSEDLPQVAVCDYWQDIAGQLHRSARQAKTASSKDYRRKLEDEYQLDQYGSNSKAYRMYMALIDAAQQGASQDRLTKLALSLCVDKADSSQ